MTTAKVREKRHASVKQGWAHSVPKFNIMDYQLSMIKVLSYFAAEVENKDKQAISISYWNKSGKNVKGLARLSDGWFAQAGPLAYLLDNNVPLEQHHEKYLEDVYQTLMDRVSKSIEDEKREVKVVSPVAVVPKDKNLILAKKLGAEIDGHIEQAFTLKGKYTFEVRDFLVKSGASAPVVKIILGFYTGLNKEMKLAGADGEYQTSEAYAWLGVRGIKRMQDWMQNLVNSLNNTALAVKTTRKPRKSNEKPKSELVAKIQYQKEEATLKLRSITPDNLIGAGIVWIFNTQYRKLFKYVAQDGMKITVKGTTLQNFDPEKSGAKTIRKPEAYFPELTNATSRPWSKAFNGVRSVMSKATGRLNQQSIILKVF